MCEDCPESAADEDCPESAADEDRPIPTSAVDGAPALTDKQRRILEYLCERAEGSSYFKSRLIGRDLGLSAKEVGTNMPALVEGSYDVDVEKWGYSSSTTWKVTV